MLLLIYLLYLIVPVNCFYRFGSSVIKPTLVIARKSRPSTSFSFLVSSPSRFLQFSLFQQQQRHQQHHLHFSSTLTNLPITNDLNLKLKLNYYLERNDYDSATPILQQLLKTNPQSWSFIDLHNLSTLINKSITNILEDYQLKELCYLLRIASSSFVISDSRLPVIRGSAENSERSKGSTESKGCPDSFFVLINQLKEQFYKKLHLTTRRGIASFLELLVSVKKKAFHIEIWNPQGIYELAFLHKIIEFYSEASCQEKRILANSDANIFAKVFISLSSLSVITKEMNEWKPFWKAMFNSLEVHSTKISARYFADICSRLVIFYLFL
jgi:hypothetical protein